MFYKCCYLSKIQSVAKVCTPPPMVLWVSKKKNNAAIYVQEIKNWRLNITMVRILKLFRGYESNSYEDKGQRLVKNY